MSQSINLVPHEEIAEQNKSKLVRFSTVLSIFLLVIISGIGAYYIYQRQTLKTEIKAIDKKIDSLRNDINSLSTIEITARNLDKRFTSITKIFENRTHYSMLLKELKKRTPDTVKIEDVLFKEDKLDISGSASDYISVATFINRLINKEFSDGDPKLKELFTDASINSVGLKNKEGGANFSIVITYNTLLLKK